MLPSSGFIFFCRWVSHSARRCWGLRRFRTMLCWAPFAICCLDRYLGQGRWIDLAGVAFTFGLAFLSGLYIGLFLAIALPAYVGVAAATGRAKVRLRQLLQLAAAGTIVAIALWPVISHYIAYGRANGYAH